MTRVALSRASGSAKYELYPLWLKAADPEVECVDLWALCEQHSLDYAMEQLQHCDGIVLTGGSDVDPSRYNRASEIGRCHVDLARDEREFAMLVQAQTRRMPILGICRGAQLLNVAYGGSLIVDIPADFSAEVEHMANEHGDAVHSIDVEGGSLLKRITRTSEGVVNSAHHQAVDALAGAFSVSARSADGIIEAFESSPTHGESTVFGVQWHPERMEYENVFSRAVATHFLFECLSYSQLVKPGL